MADCSSGQTVRSRGLEKNAENALIAYVRDAMGCDHTHALVPAPNMPNYLEGVSGTPNHRLLLRGWRCGAAWRNLRFDLLNPEKRKEADDATFWMVEFFDRQDTIEGWMYGETLTTNHPQLWQVGIYGVRILALVNKVQAVLDATGKHLRQARFMYDALNLDHHVVGPSCRCSAKGMTAQKQAASMAACDVRTVEYALMRGWPAPNRLLEPRRELGGKPNQSGGRYWKDVYNVGTAYARELLRMGDDLGGAITDGESPKLRDPLYLEYCGDDMLAVFRHLTHASDACFWAGRIKGKIVSAPYHGGEIRNLDNPYPPPELTGGTHLFITIPGINK